MTLRRMLEGLLYGKRFPASGGSQHRSDYRPKSAKGVTLRKLRTPFAVLRLTKSGGFGKTCQNPLICRRSLPVSNGTAPANFRPPSTGWFPMTIVVQCSCGRKLRAPDQMAGRAAHCVCGNSVPLIAEDGPQKFEDVEADLGEADEDALMPPLIPRHREKKPGESVFRGSRGRNVEAGEPEDAGVGLQPTPGKKKKKRRKDKVSTAERKRRGGQETFLAGVGRSLKFPFRHESLITIVMTAIVYGMFTSVAGFMRFGVLGFMAAVNMMLGTLMILGYFLYFLMQIFRLASVDEDDLPLTLEFDMDQIRQDLWLWGGSLWWCGLPYLAFLLTLGRDPELRYRIEFFAPVLGLCLFLLPMALMSTALHLSVIDANLLLVTTSIGKTVRGYLATTAVFGVIVGVAAYAGYSIPSYPSTIPVLSHIGMWLILFFALTASAYGYGNFYYRNRSHLGWFGELPKQI